MNVIDDENTSRTPNANLVLNVMGALLVIYSSALLLDLPGGLVRRKALI